MKILSVIIPVYNTPIELLNEALKSCQSNRIEVILIDDGSEIDYTEIIKNYDIKYIRTLNGGVAKARNNGIELSGGDYVTFLDSDDTFIINQKLLEALFDNDIVIARNYILKNRITENYYQYNESKKMDSGELKRNMFVLDARTIECTETVWSKFYKKSYLQDSCIRFNEELKRGEDVLFNYEAYSKARNILYCNEFSYNYRMTNTDSITRSFDGIMDITMFKLLEEFEKLFKKLDVKDENYPIYVFRIIIRLMRKYYVHLSKDEFDNKIDLLFSNNIIEYYLNNIDLTNLDKYKLQLYKLLIIKDKIKLYNYLRDVCDKKLLKK